MRYVSIVLVSLSLAGVAVAQSGAPVTQTSSPARQVQVSSPYWNQGPSQASDLPAAEIRAVPAAHAAAVQARWTYIQTGTDLSNAVRVMQMQMELRPEYVKAVADEKAAYDALEAARRNALAPLADNAAYNGSEQLRSNLTQQIADEQFQIKPDNDRLLALARLKVEYGKDNRKLESAVLERDPAYQAAKQRYVDAGQRVLALKHQQALAIATDDNLVAIRKQYAEARIASLTTGAYYQSALEARNGAVNYALLYRGVDIYHGNGYYPYGGYGYGYGYGVGYGY